LFSSIVVFLRKVMKFWLLAIYAACVAGTATSEPVFESCVAAEAAGSARIPFDVSESAAPASRKADPAVYRLRGMVDAMD
jgi:hypothetical protein